MDLGHSGGEQWRCFNDSASLNALVTSSDQFGRAIFIAPPNQSPSVFSSERQLRCNLHAISDNILATIHTLGDPHSE
jgi:hypothetical protein